MGICSENYYCFAASQFLKDSADFVVMPHSSPDMSNSGGLPSPTGTQIASWYSTKLGVPVAMVNKVGRSYKSPPNEINGVFPGRSAIVDSDGAVLQSMGDTEGIGIADITLAPARKTHADQVCTGLGIAELAVGGSTGAAAVADEYARAKKSYDSNPVRKAKGAFGFGEALNFSDFVLIRGGYGPTNINKGVSPRVRRRHNQAEGFANVPTGEPNESSGNFASPRLGSLGRLGDEMGTTAISECRELSRELAATLSPQHELFAVYVASGLSYRESARRAGFHEDNGFRLTKISAVRARIEELASEPSERIRAGIDAELLMLRNRAANEDLNAEGRANIELRLKLLLAHAKLRGWIVDKKQVAKLSASVRMDRADLDAITADLERLAPGAIGQLERLKRAPTQVDIARIAAGEDDQRDGAA